MDLINLIPRWPQLAVVLEDRGDRGDRGAQGQENMREEGEAQEDEAQEDEAQENTENPIVEERHCIIHLNRVTTQEKIFSGPGGALIGRKHQKKKF